MKKETPTTVFPIEFIRELNSKTKQSTPVAFENEEDFFMSEDYINSSPLTETEKELLSTSNVGETRLVGNGLLKFMKWHPSPSGLFLCLCFRLKHFKCYSLLLTNLYSIFH